MAMNKRQPVTTITMEMALDSKPQHFVLVGTYRKDQLKKWILPEGLYNYPIHAEDTAIKTAAPNVRELWLYAGKKDKLHFEARFDREVSADVLEKLGYPRGKEKPHSDRYLLFKVSPLVEDGSHRGTEAQSEPQPRILVRLTDFKRSASKLAEIRKALAGASAAKDAKGAKPFTYLDFLPDDLLSDWTDSLCVCEEALQMRFWDIPEMSALRPRVPFPPPEHPTFTFVDLFAGMGGFRIAMQAQGGKCVFSSEWNPYAQKTYEANFGDVPYGENSLQQEVA